MRRAARMRGAPDVAHRLDDASVVGGGHPGLLHLRLRGAVDHHGHVHVVEVAQAHQLRLAAEKLQLPRPALAPLATRRHRTPRPAPRRRRRGLPDGRAPWRRAVPSRPPACPRSARCDRMRAPRRSAGSATGWPATTRPSSSPSSAKVGPSLAPRASARTPVTASPARGERPSSFSVSSTSRAVLNSLNPSSGLPPDGIAEPDDPLRLHGRSSRTPRASRHLWSPSGSFRLRRVLPRWSGSDERPRHARPSASRNAFVASAGRRPQDGRRSQPPRPPPRRARLAHALGRDASYGDDGPMRPPSRACSSAWRPWGFPYWRFDGVS